MTEKELMLSKQLYIPYDKELTKDNKNAREITRIFNNTTEKQNEYRMQLLKKLFKKNSNNL